LASSLQQRRSPFLFLVSEGGEGRLEVEEEEEATG